MAIKRPGNFRNPRAPRSGPQQAGIYYLRRTNRAARLVDDLGQPSWGTINFSANPSSGDTVALNGAVITFGTDIPIGPDLKTTLASLVIYANANSPNAIFDMTGDATIMILSHRLADTTYTLAASAATCSSTHLQLQQNRQRVGLVSGLTFVNMNMGLDQVASVSHATLSVAPTITLDLISAIAPTNDHAISATPNLNLVMSATLDNSTLGVTAVMNMGLAETAIVVAGGVSLSATIDLGLSIAEMGNDSTYGLTAIVNLGLNSTVTVGNSIFFGATISLDVAETAVLDHSQISVNATIDMGLSLAETVLAGSPAFIPATTMTLGVTETAAGDASMLSVAATMALGVTEAATMDHGALSIGATIQLGLSEVTTAQVDIGVSATIILGMTETAMATAPILSVAATMTLGVTETAITDNATMSVAATMAVGVTEAVTVTNLGVDYVAATMTLGVTETAITDNGAMGVAATMTLGVTETAITNSGTMGVAATMTLGVTETATMVPSWISLTLPAGAVGIYSTRKVTGYGGTSVVDVTAADSSTHTIGFVGGRLDYATMAALAQPVRITKWYDQSGNGNDLVQSTAANGPTLFNGRDEVIFDGDVNVNIRTISMNLPAGLSLDKASQTVLMAATGGTALDKQFLFDLGGMNSGMVSNLTGGLRSFWVGPTYKAGGQVIPTTPSTIGLASGAGSLKIIADGQTVTDTSVPSGSGTGGIIGRSSDAGFAAQNAQFGLAAIVIYNTQLSPTDLATVTAAYRTCFNTDASYANMAVFVGDSLTGGSQALQLQNLPRQVVSDFPTCKFYNVGIGGSDLASLTTFYPTYTKPLRSGSYTYQVLHFWAGINDIFDGRTAGQIQTDIQTYCQTAMADGFVPIVATLLPGSAARINSTQNTTRQAVNTWLRANWPSFAAGLADYANNATIGDAANVTSNTTYYADGLHLTAIGYAALKPDLEAALVNALNSVKATLSLGVTETAATQVTLSVSATMSLGVTETATVVTPVSFAINASGSASGITSGSYTSGTVTTKAVTINNTAPALIVLIIAANTGGGWSCPINTPTGGGLTFTKATGAAQQNAPYYADVEVWTAYASATGSKTFTVTFAGQGADAMVIAALAITGGKSSSFLDANANAQKYTFFYGGGATSQTGISTTTANDYTLAILYHDYAPYTATLPSGYTSVLRAASSVPWDGLTAVLTIAAKTDSGTLSSVTQSWGTPTTNIYTAALTLSLVPGP